MNVNGILNNQGWVASWVHLGGHDTDVIALCELRVSNEAVVPTIPGFTLHTKLRPQRARLDPIDAADVDEREGTRTCSTRTDGGRRRPARGHASASGGMAFYTRDSTIFVIKEIHLRSTNPDFLALKVAWTATKSSRPAVLNLGCAYRRRSIGLQGMALLEEAMTQLSAEDDGPCVIVGDFNCRSTSWGDSIQDNDGRKLAEMCDKLDLAVLNSTWCLGVPTRLNLSDSARSEGSVIDLALTSDAAIITHMKVVHALSMSDHAALLLHVHMPRDEATVCGLRRRVMSHSKTEWHDVAMALEGMAAPLLELCVAAPNLGTHELVDKLSSGIMWVQRTECAWHLQRQGAPWWTQEIDRHLACLKKERNRLSRLWKRKREAIFSDSTTHAAWVHLKETCRGLARCTNTLIKKTRQDFVRKQLATGNLHLAGFWSTYRRGNPKLSPLPIVSAATVSNVNGDVPDVPAREGLTASPESRLNLLAEHFRAISCLGARSPGQLAVEAEVDAFEHALREQLASQPNSGKVYTNSQHLPHAQATALEGFDEISTEEVCEYLRTLESRKASGPDGISQAVLKAGTDSRKFCELLAVVFNTSVSRGEFPLSWKASHTFCLSKVSPPTKNADDYRGISLLSTVGKLLEGLVASRLLNLVQLEQHGGIHPGQTGFLPSKSTTEHLVSVSSAVADAFYNSQELLVVFLDLVKAYDKTWTHGLLHKIMRRNIPACLFLWISDFLKGRSTRCVHGSFSSKWVVLQDGLPQGSRISCLLFLLFIDDLIRVLNTGSIRALGYADDIALHRKVTAPLTRPLRSNPAEADSDTAVQFMMIQDALDQADEWAEENMMKFSPRKSVSVLFSRRRRRVNAGSANKVNVNTPLFIHRVPLTAAERFKYLGLWFSKSLSWTFHSHYVMNKMKKALLIVTKLRSMFLGPSPYQLTHLVNSMMRSVAEYGAEAWEPSPAMDKHFSRILNRGYRLSVGAYKTSSGDRLRRSLELPTLATRRAALRASYGLKVLAKDMEPPTASHERGRLSSQSASNFTRLFHDNFVANRIDDRSRRVRTRPSVLFLLALESLRLGNDVHVAVNQQGQLFNAPEEGQHGAAQRNPVAGAHSNSQLLRHHHGGSADDDDDCVDDAEETSELDEDTQHATFLSRQSFAEVTAKERLSRVATTIPKVASLDLAASVATEYALRFFELSEGRSRRNWDPATGISLSVKRRANDDTFLLYHGRERRPEDCVTQRTLSCDNTTEVRRVEVFRYHLETRSTFFLTSLQKRMLLVPGASTLCRLCQKALETPAHVLLECAHLSRHRQVFLYSLSAALALDARHLPAEIARVSRPSLCLSVFFARNCRTPAVRRVTGEFLDSVMRLFMPSLYVRRHAFADWIPQVQFFRPRIPPMQRSAPQYDLSQDDIAWVRLDRRLLRKQQLGALSEL